MAQTPVPVPIGMASGLYGGRFAAMREMLEGGNLDLLTGDYRAELTMLILGRDRLRDPGLGFARTFVPRLEDCLGLAVKREVAIVANARGLNPAGLAAAVDQPVQTLGGSSMTAEADLASMRASVRASRIAPVSRVMILNSMAQHSLGLPKSYQEPTDVL